MSGTAEAAVEQLRALLPRVRRLDDPGIEKSLLNVMLGHLRLFITREEIAEAVDRLDQLSPLVDDHELKLHSLEVRIHWAIASGRFDRYEVLQAELDRLLAYGQSTFWFHIAANHEATIAFLRGDLAECERLSERCLDLATSLPGVDGSGTFGLRMFMIRREQDRLASLAPLISRLLEEDRSTSFWTPGLALLLAETGSTDEAQAVLTELASGSDGIPRDAMWSTVLVLATETAAILADASAAQRLRDLLEPLSGQHVVSGAAQFCFGSADRYLGILSFLLGDLTAAEDHLGRALAADDASGSVLWSNESRLWLSRVRRAQDHADEAEAMREVVIEQAAAAGLTRLVRAAVDDG
jgi:tetratricopeptide (TPR) repeat protein